MDRAKRLRSLFSFHSRGAIRAQRAFRFFSETHPGAPAACQASLPKLNGNIDAAEAGDGVVDEAANIVVATDVGADKDGVGAEFAKLGFQRLAFGFTTAGNDQSASCGACVRPIARHVQAGQIRSHANGEMFPGATPREDLPSGFANHDGSEVASSTMGRAPGPSASRAT
jgi:hypothetical protein